MWYVASAQMVWSYCAFAQLFQADKEAIARATKSQIFFCLLQSYENQFSRSYHEGITSF